MQRQMLVAGLVIFGSLVLRTPSASAQPTAVPEVNPKLLAFVKPVDIAGTDSELRKKQKEKHNVAVQLLEDRVNDYKKGIRDVNSVYEAARIVADAKVDLAENQQARAAVLGEVVEVAKLFESRLEEQLKKGFGSKSDLARARLARLTVEIELLRAQGK